MLAGGGLLAIAGCLPGRDPAPVAPVDPELRTRARIAAEVQAVARHYDAVMASFPAARAELALLAAEHEAHARALLGPRTPTPSPSPSSSSAASTPVPDVPDTLDAARITLVDAERAASRRRARQAGRASPDLARLLASVAACEAAHAVLLSPPAGSA